MPTELVGLPHLVLDCIVTLLDAESVAPFSATCRWFSQLSSKRLTKQRQLWKEHKHVRIGYSQHQGAGSSLFTFVQDLQRDPEIAYFVRTMSFSPSEMNDEDGRHKCDTLDFESFVHTAGRSWLDEETCQSIIDRKSQEHIDMRKFEGAVFVSLLTQLLDLRRLELLGNLRYYIDLLNKLVREVTLAGSSLATPAAPGVSKLPLRKVQELFAEHWDTENGEALDNLRLLRFLPALEKIQGFLIEDYDEIDQDDLYKPKYVRDAYLQHPGICNVTEVSFMCSAISPGMLWEFIMHVPRLKRVIYEHGGAIVGGDPDIGIEDYIEHFDAMAAHWTEERGMESRVSGQDEMTVYKVKRHLTFVQHGTQTD